MIPAVILAIIFEIGFPIALAIWFVRRYKVRWPLIWIGALTFIISQVGHIPFNLWLNSLFINGALPLPPFEWRILFSAVVGGLSAGLFEETSRLGAMTLLRNRARGWKEAIALGVGHGGIESVLIGLGVLSSLITMLAFRQNPELLEQVNQPGLAAQVEAFWQTPWHLPLAGAFERLNAIILHLSLSVLVMQVFLRRSFWYYLAAVAWHALVDGVIIVLANSGWDAWPIELVILLMNILSIYIIIAFRPKGDIPVAEPVPAPLE